MKRVFFLLLLVGCGAGGSSTEGRPAKVQGFVQTVPRDEAKRLPEVGADCFLDLAICPTYDTKVSECVKTSMCLAKQFRDALYKNSGQVSAEGEMRTMDICWSTSNARTGTRPESEPCPRGDVFVPSSMF